MIDEDILNKAANHVEILHKKNDREGFFFHNISYINSILGVASELANRYQISQYYQKPLLLAAIFKDAGMIVDPKAPEKHSEFIAENFLRDYGADEELITRVISLIRTVYHPRTDPSLLERIIHDAGISYMGKKSFFKDSELLRMEYENLLNKFITDYEWEKHLYKLVSEASFQTQAGFNQYEKTRVGNQKKQLDRMNKARKKSVKKAGSIDYERSISTYYRINFQNHINLSSVSDRKANVMISLNTVILAVIVILSGMGLTFYNQLNANNNYRFFAPVIVLLLSSLLSIIFSILSARPKVNGNRSDINKIRENKTSLISSMNFRNLNLNDFVIHMRELKKDPQWIYDNLSTELYYFVIALNEKYRLLHWSYTIFMIGIGISTILFVFIFSDAITP
jgi:hypothetical protein